MIPADKVMTVAPTDSARKAMDLMLKHKIGAVVVLVTGTYHVPIGIITKTNLIEAYHDGLTLDRAVKEIMNKQDLVTCTENMSRDQVARILETNKTHHVIVVDKNEHFCGLVTAWDITVECAKDDRAWPWNRSEDGKFHKPSEHATEMSTSPTSTTQPVNPRPVQRRSQQGDSFRAYIDTLGYFD
jgi:CBS domain-containing protein